MLSESRLADIIGKYDAEATFTNFKNIPNYATVHLLHQVCSSLRRHADFRLGLGFAACHSKSLFNDQVQNRGWSSMRAYHDQALIDEFQRRGIDITSVYDGKTISFAHPVRCPLPYSRLVVFN